MKETISLTLISQTKWITQQLSDF